MGDSHRWRVVVAQERGYSRIMVPVTDIQGSWGRSHGRIALPGQRGPALATSKSAGIIRPALAGPPRERPQTLTWSRLLPRDICW